jgi:mannose-6-phosphate isomerase-like protein (cupin superfamily)
MPSTGTLSNKKMKVDDSVKNKTMFHTQKLKEKPDDIAPDGSKIYLLNSLNGGGMCLCELPVSQTTQAVKYKTVEEIWFFLSGEGKVWRKMGEKEEVTLVSKDISVTIPIGCGFSLVNKVKVRRGEGRCIFV